MVPLLPCVVTIALNLSRVRHIQLFVLPLTSLLPATIVVFPQSHRHSHRCFLCLSTPVCLTTSSLPNFLPFSSSAFDMFPPCKGREGEVHASPNSSPKPLSLEMLNDASITAARRI